MKYVIYAHRADGSTIHTTIGHELFPGTSRLQAGAMIGRVLETGLAARLTIEQWQPNVRYVENSPTNTPIEANWSQPDDALTRLFRKGAK